MVKPAMLITIADDSTGEFCEVECGTDWSSGEIRTLAEERIEEKLSGRGQLEYIDLSQDGDSQRALELKREIGDALLPALLIDGHIRIGGNFDIRQMLDAIEVEMELNG